MDRPAHLAADPNPQVKLQGLEVGDGDVSIPQWPVQIICAFCLFLIHKSCFVLLYIILISLTIETQWPSGSKRWQHPTGPGFESQVPHALCYIFSSDDQVQIQA